MQTLYFLRAVFFFGLTVLGGYFLYFSVLIAKELFEHEN